MGKNLKRLSDIQFDKERAWLLEEKYHGKQDSMFFSDVERIKKGEPIDHVIGFTPFFDCRIDLSDRPLIPRAETEFWVEHAIKEILNNLDGNKKKTLQCLDLFSGSGCIGIALLKHITSATVVFGDDQANCLEQIQKNIEQNNIDTTRTRIYRSDCFKKIPQQKYDYIFANPPYIARERQGHVQRSVTAWEPHHALFAKDNGLYYIKKIILEAPAFLKNSGTLFMEFDSWQKETIENFIPLNKYTYTFWKDQFEKWRVVVLQKTSQ